MLAALVSELGAAPPTCMPATLLQAALQLLSMQSHCQDAASACDSSHGLGVQTWRYARAKGALGLAQSTRWLAACWGNNTTCGTGASTLAITAQSGAQQITA
jgi:hypothetical protein